MMNVDLLKKIKKFMECNAEIFFTNIFVDHVLSNVNFSKLLFQGHFQLQNNTNS